MFLECYRRSILVLTFLSFVFLGCEFPSDPQVKRVVIVLKAEFLGDGAFMPNPVRVPWAGKITWKNEDHVSHSIVGDADSGPCFFKSKPIEPGKQFSKTFHQKMICPYYCGLHGRSMRGILIVD